MTIKKEKTIQTTIFPKIPQGGVGQNGQWGEMGIFHILYKIPFKGALSGMR